MNRYQPPQYKRDLDILERVQHRITKMAEGQKHVFCEESLREMGLLNLEKRRPREDLTEMYE